MVVETILTFGLGWLLGRGTGGAKTPSKVPWPTAEAPGTAAHVPKPATGPSAKGRPLTKKERVQVQKTIPGDILYPNDPSAAAAHDISREMG